MARPVWTRASGACDDAPAVLLRALDCARGAGPHGVCERIVESFARLGEERARELGQEGQSEVERTVGLVRDPALVGYVSEIGRRLVAQAAQPNASYEFHVADDTEPNAFAFPAGSSTSRGASWRSPTARTSWPSWGTRSVTSWPATPCVSSRRPPPSRCSSASRAPSSASSARRSEESSAVGKLASGLAVAA